MKKDKLPVTYLCTIKTNNQIKNEMEKKCLLVCVYIQKIKMIK